MSATNPTPEDWVKAHQYLYYVKTRPVLSDFDYDRFCSQHGIQGGGGSDCESDYPTQTKLLARLLQNGEVATPPA